MTQFTLLDPHFVERVRASFDRQQVMATLGASLARVEPGEVEIPTEGNTRPEAIPKNPARSG